MRSRSAKTAARDRRYAIERPAFLEAHPWCEAGLEWACTLRSSEVHHMAGRGADVFFRQDLWKALCSSCHAWVTEHPKLARHYGLSLHSSADHSEAS